MTYLEEGVLSCDSDLTLAGGHLELSSSLSCAGSGLLLERLLKHQTRLLLLRRTSLSVRILL